MNNSLLGFPSGQNTAEPVTGLGYGQTWQNVVGSRALGTTYYNTTGRPIYIAGYATNAGGLSLRVDIGALAVSTTDSGSLNFVVFSTIVPPGASYAVVIGAGTGTLTAWRELR